MGTKQFLAFSFSNTFSAIFYGSTLACISYKLMLSTPAPIPISIIPALILAAMFMHASRPEEHCLLTDINVVVSGNPAKNSPHLDELLPAPGCKTFPTAMSSTFFGSSLTLSTTAFNTVESITSGKVSLRPPLLALVRGVLTAATMTTSSSDLAILFCVSWPARDSSLSIMIQ